VRMGARSEWSEKIICVSHHTQQDADPDDAFCREYIFSFLCVDSSILYLRGVLARNPRTSSQQLLMRWTKHRPPSLDFAWWVITWRRDGTGLVGISVSLEKMTREVLSLEHLRRGDDHLLCEQER